VLGGAYDEGRASPVDLQSHVIRCSGRQYRLAESAAYAIRADGTGRNILASADPEQAYVCVSKPNTVGGGRVKAGGLVNRKLRCRRENSWSFSRPIRMRRLE